MTDLMKKRVDMANRLLPWYTKDSVLNGSPKIIFCDEDTFIYDHETKVNGKIQKKRIKVSCKEEKTLDMGQPPVEEQEKAELISPDGRHAIIVRDYNLFLKDCLTGDVRQLTFDGKKDYGYAAAPYCANAITNKRFNLGIKPEALWNNSSTGFVSYQLDVRNVGDLYLIQSYDGEGKEGIRPKLYSYKCPFPEDEYIPMAQLCYFNIERNTVVRLENAPIKVDYALINESESVVKWLPDDSGFYFTQTTRGDKIGRLWFYDTESEEYKAVVEEKTDRFLNLSSYGELDGFGTYSFSNFITNDRKFAIWQSERDGFARLYKYSLEEKRCIGPITPEKVIVQKLIRYVPEENMLYFMANNFTECSEYASVSNPYYHLLCRVRLDGTGFCVITPEDAEHTAVMSDKYIVDTYSRVDMPPVTIIRNVDGGFIKELVKADITELLNRGFVWPKRFSVKASDGKTDIYGVLIPPANLNPDSTYPVIDYIYGGMQTRNVPSAFCWTLLQGREIYGGLEEYAQLGFAGIIIDGLGTPGRGREIHDVCYHNIHGCAGLKDHVTCLKQLKEKFSFLDIERIGMWGNSGGGCATVRAMLEYPDVYKVGVASAGNHDQRMYDSMWTERYYGLFDEKIYSSGDNTSLAANLKGKLLIVCGAMDDNVPMSQSLRLVDALIREDKDFDFLMLPRVNHNVPADKYFIRKKMEYFINNLLTPNERGDFYDKFNEAKSRKSK